MATLENLNKLTRPELHEVILAAVYDLKIRRAALNLLEKRIRAESDKKYNNLIKSI